jgi:hypothetical protein
MPFWKVLKNLVFEGGISDLVLYAVGGWQIVLLIMMGGIFVFSAGLLFERMKKYKTLRRIAGMIAVFGFGVLCLDMFAKLRGDETKTRHESILEFILPPYGTVVPASTPVVGEIEETRETTESAKSGAK